jgi:fructose-1,6-bisphosphatase/inositol monophosphatase family enzyme
MFISFLGEETYDPAVPLSADPTFVCDPIDG